MPELPEVETVRRTLKNLILDKKITNIDIRYGNIIEYPNIEEFKKNIINQTFNDIKVPFDDGSFEIEMSDGTILKGEASNPSVTSNGRLIVDNSFMSDEFNSIVFKEENLKKYKFTNAVSMVDGVDIAKLITKSSEFSLNHNR